MRILLAIMIRIGRVAIRVSSRGTSIRIRL